MFIAYLLVFLDNNNNKLFVVKSQTLTDLYLGIKNIPLFILLVDGLIMFLPKYSCEVFSVEQLRTCKQTVLTFLRLHCILIIVDRNRIYFVNILHLTIQMVLFGRPSGTYPNLEKSGKRGCLNKN